MGDDIFAKGSSRRTFIWSLAAGTLVAGAATPLRSVQAAQKQFRFVDFGGRNSPWSAPFAEFAKQLKDKSGGEMQAQFVGGPEVIGVFQAADAVSKGVFDMAHQANSFYAAAMPEATATASGHASTEKLRAAGAVDLYGKVMRERMGTEFLGFPTSGTRYMILSKKPIKTLSDLKGMKLRSIPIYDPLFKALGAATLRTAPAEVYTALERGVVDGLGWVEWGIVQNRLQEVTKYWVQPGFYSVRSSYLMNGRTYDGLAAAQKQVLKDAMIATENWGEAYCQKQRDDDFAAAMKAGVEIVTLPDTEGKKLQSMAQKVLWDGIMAKSPKHGTQLKAVFDKADSMG